MVPLIQTEALVKLHKTLKSFERRYLMLKMRLNQGTLILLRRLTTLLMIS